MKVEVKPVEVPHESILAIRLHQEVLTAEYNRLVKKNRGSKNKETLRAMDVLRDKMSDCRKAEEVLVKWIEDTTNNKTNGHTSKTESMQGHGPG